MPKEITDQEIREFLKLWYLMYGIAEVKSIEGLNNYFSEEYSRLIFYLRVVGYIEVLHNRSDKVLYQIYVTEKLTQKALDLIEEQD